MLWHWVILRAHHSCPLSETLGVSCLHVWSVHCFAYSEKSRLQNKHGLTPRRWLWTGHLALPSEKLYSHLIGSLFIDGEALRKQVQSRSRVQFSIAVYGSYGVRRSMV